MEMIPVQSRNITAIGYDDDSAILTISFKDGTMYEYYDVPRFEFDNLYDADSKGGYAHKNIYKNFRQQKIA